MKQNNKLREEIRAILHEAEEYEEVWAEPVIDQILSKVKEEIERELPYPRVKGFRDKDGYHWHYEKREGFNEALKQVKEILDKLL